MFNPASAPTGGAYFLTPFETAAASIGVKPIALPVHNVADIAPALATLGREPGGGLVVIADVITVAHRAAIISAAARNRVPAVYSASEGARDGGLLSYGVDPLRRSKVVPSGA